MSVTALYLEMDIFCGAILIFLLSRMIREDLQQYSQVLYQKLTVCALMVCLLDATWAVTEGRFFSGARELNLMVNCVYYLLLALGCYYWFLFSENEQGNAFTRTRQGRCICALPLAALGILDLASFKTGWVYAINDLNQWQSGPYLLLQLLICDGYIFLTSLKALYKAFHADSYDQHEKFLWLSFYAVPLLVNAMIINLTMEVAITSVTTTFSILMVYIFLQEQHISLDPLTRLNNRYELRRYMHEALKRSQNKDDLYLLVLDVDRFKNINDQYGHIEGDKALVRLADAMRETGKTFDSFLARYGGDEFIMLYKAAEPADIKLVMETLNNNLRRLNQTAGSPYELTVSIGYALYQAPLTTAEELIAAADEKLYAAKNKKKGLVI
jgi:diguanylate cyclase (GGDEF)-like protein